MPSRLIFHLKVVVHVVCLLPVMKLVMLYRSGALAAMADPVNYITHLTGYWALWFLLAGLAVTPVRRLHAALGWMIRFRRMLGLYAFFYATLHLLTYVLLFSGYDMAAAIEGVRAGHLMQPWIQLKMIWPTMLDDLRKRRFIQVGLVAWVILLALAVTSPQWVMRAMGGVNWRRLHWLVYVAGVAGCVHYWWLVKAGVRTPLPMTAVLVVLLAWRVGYWARKRVVANPRAKAQVTTGV